MGDRPELKGVQTFDKSQLKKTDTKESSSVPTKESKSIGYAGCPVKKSTVTFKYKLEVGLLINAMNFEILAINNFFYMRILPYHDKRKY